MCLCFLCVVFHRPNEIRIQLSQSRTPISLIHAITAKVLNDRYNSFLLGGLMRERMSFDFAACQHAENDTFCKAMALLYR